MRLPDEVQKCVVFLGRREMNQRTGVIEERLGGTAFFVALEVGMGASLICLVTAAHVAKQVENGEFFIRANTKKGVSQKYWLDAGITARWIFHPDDSSVDAAVLLWAPPPEVDFLCIPKSMFLPESKIDSKGIGVGDETYVTGLFLFHAGQDRNEPIVRTGNLAMMPKERIPVKRWHKRGINGYLIEGRSIGGFSGSPVFVQRSIEVQPTETSGRRPLAAGAIFWLGLMHGHWNADHTMVDSVQSSTDPESVINAGVSIVVPCHSILEVLSHPAIRETANKALAYLEQHHPSMIDGGSPMLVKDGKVEAANRHIISFASTASAIVGGVTAQPVSQFTSKIDSTRDSKGTSRETEPSRDNS